MASTMIEPDHASRDELAEAITNMAATAARMPAHWAERKAELHRQINDLLDDLDAEVCGDVAMGFVPAGVERE